MEEKEKQVNSVFDKLGDLREWLYALEENKTVNH